MATELDDLRVELDALGGATRAAQASPTLAALLEHAWEQGWAWEVLCDARQVDWVRAFLASDESWCWGHGRQRGKSFGALTLCDVTARATPKSRARYCALTIESARSIINSASEDLYAACPPELRPKKDSRSDDLIWPNGSRLVVLGTDAQSFRRGRGFSRIGLQVLDECGFYQDLSAVERALNPGLQVPGASGKPGRNIYCSTPAESPAHPYTTVKRVHKGAGRLLQETFRDNPRIDPEKVVRDEMARTGMTREELLESSAFRREYGGEDVIESTRAAVPAWTPEREARLVRAIDRPAFFDGYSALDLGFSPDPHFYLLGWHHVAASAIVFEHELELHGKTVSELAAAVKALELEAWGSDRYDGTLLALATEVAELPEFLARKVHRDAPRQPFLRVGDNNALVLAELASEHGLAVMPTRKDEKALAVDAFNQLVASERVFVNPRCKRVIEQLRATVWNVARTGWERTTRDHGDAIDCAVYFSRNVRWNRDCRPQSNTLAPFIEREKPNANAWGKAFGGK